MRSFFRSTRRRYVLQTALAIAALVAAFALVVLLAVSLRFLMVAEENARTVVASLGNIQSGMSPRASAVLKSFSSLYDPHVEVLRPNGTVALLSANQKGPLPPATPGVRLGHFPAYRLVAQENGWRVLVDWPLAPTLDLIHDLFFVLTVTTALAALAGAFVGRHTIHRILQPVEAMSSAARAMRAGQSELRMPNLPDSGDEFARLAETLTMLLQDLELQRKRDREFLARAAHELRTPLQILAGNVRLLTTRKLDPAEEAQSLAAIDRAVQRMTRLTRDLLTLEHAQNVRPSRRPVAIVPLLEQLAEDVRALAPEHHVEVESRLQMAEVDEDALRRSLWALLENAAAYSPAGSHIRLEAEENTSEFIFSVIDDGPGIPESERPYVFDRFFRGQAAQLREGTGLGLAIVRSLVEAQHGTVEIGSEVPHGTRVVIRLPK